MRLGALCVWYSYDSVVRKRVRVAGTVYDTVLVLILRSTIHTNIRISVQHGSLVRNTWYSHCACASMPTANARSHARAMNSSIIRNAN